MGITRIDIKHCWEEGPTPEELEAIMGKQDGSIVYFYEDREWRHFDLNPDNLPWIVFGDNNEQA